MTEKLQAVLEAEGLSSLLGKFNEHGVTDSILGDLSDSDLKELGIDKLGERKRLIASFKESRGAVDPQPQSRDINISSPASTLPIEDQIQIIAAEPYLSMSPHEALKKFLKDCGGYDMTLAEAVIMFPAEPRFVKDPNAQSQVMSSVVRVSQLMLQFYRGQLVSGGTAATDTLLQKLGLRHPSELDSLALTSTGKMKPSNDLMQQDFVDFLGGRSKCLLKDDVNGQQTAEPLIRNIGDFRVHPLGHEVFKTFVQLCNESERGPVPSNLQKAGSAFNSILKGLEDIGDTLGKLS